MKGLYYRSIINPDISVSFSEEVCYFCNSKGLCIRLGDSDYGQCFGCMKCVVRMWEASKNKFVGQSLYSPEDMDAILESVKFRLGVTHYHDEGQHQIYNNKIRYSASTKELVGCSAENGKPKHRVGRGKRQVKYQSDTDKCIAACQVTLDTLSGKTNIIPVFVTRFADVSISQARAHFERRGWKTKLVNQGSHKCISFSR